MTTTTVGEPDVLEQPARIETARPVGGTVYTDTVIFSAPEAFVSEAPYQIAIIDLDEGGRLTARVAGDNVSIGDRVEFLELRNGIPFFNKTP